MSPTLLDGDYTLCTLCVSAVFLLAHIKNVVINTYIIKHEFHLGITVQIMIKQYRADPFLWDGGEGDQWFIDTAISRYVVKSNDLAFLCSMFLVHLIDKFHI